MRVYSTVCSSPTRGNGFCDLTDEVHTAILDAGVRDGRVSVFSTDVGCAVFLNENESGLRADLERTFARLEGGALAGSASVVVPVVDGEPWLGDWQRVMAFARAVDGRFVIQVSGA